MFGWEFPPLNSGGLGVACYGLTRALSHAGIDVTFVLPKKADITSPFCRLLYADSSAYPSRGFYSGYLTEGEYRTLAAGHGQYGWNLLDEVRRYALNARIVAKGEQFDLIHAHDWLTMLAGIEAKKLTGKPLIVHVHATEFDRTGHGNVNQDVYDIERAGMHYADRVIAVSEFTKRILIQHYGVPAWKIDVVHNSVDDDDCTVSEIVTDEVHALKSAGNSIVLFVGRITLQKGPDYFVRVAKRVLDHKRNTYFVVCGSGDMEQQIMQQAAYLGISDRMFFVGFLRGRDLSRMYRLADVLIMPSVSEPFGIVPLEALKNGTPVIVSKQSGVAEILQHALKADFWDVEEMSDFILAITTSAPLRQCLAEYGRNEAGARKWHHAADACVDIYRSVLALNHPHDVRPLLSGHVV